MRTTTQLIFSLVSFFISKTTFAQIEQINNVNDTIITTNQINLNDQDSSSKTILSSGDAEIDGSLGIGIDMFDSYVYGFDTFVLRENNLRILFDDTSNSGSFPGNDWRITANDSDNGGGNYFGIDDATALTRPFRIDAGAGNNALYIEAGGNVGFGNTNPVVKLHATNGDTPALRLEQNGSSGWTPQTFDIAANETNFFIRDVTNNLLNFRIQPGSETRNALTIRSNGSIGIKAMGADSWATINPNASLELGANDKGLQLNRMTTSNRITLGAALGASEVGVVVFDTDDALVYVWDGISWESLNSNAEICSAPNNLVSNPVFGTATTTSLKLFGFDAPRGDATGFVIYMNNSNTFNPPSDGDILLPDTSWNNAGQQPVYFSTSVFSNLTITGLSPNTEYFFQIYAYNNCNNTTRYETTGLNVSDTTESSLPLDMSAGVGIGTTTPVSAFDVDGSVRALNRNNSGTLYNCNANVEGTFGYDKEDKELKVCTNKSGLFEWRALSFK